MSRIAEASHERCPNPDDFTDQTVFDMAIRQWLDAEEAELDAWDRAQRMERLRAVPGQILVGLVGTIVVGAGLFYAGCIVFALIGALFGTPPIHPEYGS